MKEIAKIVEELHFKPKTITTIYTHKNLLGIKNKGLINETCYYLYLYEIEQWLFEEFNFFITIDIVEVSASLTKGYRFSYCIFDIIESKYIEDDSPLGYLTIQLAKQFAILKTLKLIKI